MSTPPASPAAVADPAGRDSSARTAAPFLERLSGGQVGQRIELHEGELLLGRGEEADVRLDGCGVSRLHAALSVGAARVVLYDMGSANRSFVNDVPVAEGVTLHDGDRVQLAGVVFRFHDRRAAGLPQDARVRQLATTDPVSGALTRRTLQQVAERAFAQAAAQGRPLALLGCSLDRCGALRSLHGQEAVDVVLRECTRLLRDHLPARAALGRWSPDEFLVVVGDAGVERALQLAEQLRLAVAGHGFDLEVAVQGRLRRILDRQTVSVGLAVLGAGCRDVHDLQAAADRRLYAARRDGGNRVVAVDLAGPATVA